MNKITLPSRLEMVQPTERLRRFCEEEFAYYDGIHSTAPNQIEPVDVLVTVSVNSFITNARQARTVHRGLAVRCDPLLARIPEDADLLAFDPSLDLVGNLLHSAVQAPGVLVPVATKVLHRKRRSLIPMLDKVVLGYYLERLGKQALLPETQHKERAAGVAVTVLDAFRSDLTAVQEEIEGVHAALAASGFPLTPVRILEVLVWISVERTGYYRSDGVPAG